MLAIEATSVERSEVAACEQGNAGELEVSGRGGEVHGAVKLAGRERASFDRKSIIAAVAIDRQASYQSCGLDARQCSRFFEQRLRES